MSFSKRNTPIFILVVILFFVLRVPFINRGLVIEESTAISSGVGVLTSGFPYFDVDMFTRRAVGIGHPPLLNWLLGGSFALFGVSEWSARLVLLCTAALLLCAIMRFVYRFFDAPTALLAGILFAILPFSIQNALHIQYDGAIIALALFLSFVAARKILRDGLAMGAGSVFVLGAMLLYYSKPEVWILFWITLGFYVGLYAREGKCLRRAISIFLLWIFSGAAYFISYYVYASLFGHPEVVFGSSGGVGGHIAGVFLERLSLLFHNPRAGIVAFAGSAALTYKFFIWILLPTTIALFTAFVIFVREKQWRSELHGFLWLWFLIPFVGYVVLGYGGNIYPRYAGIVVAPLIIILADAIRRALQIPLLRSELFVAVGVSFLAPFLNQWIPFFPYRGDIVFHDAFLFLMVLATASLGVLAALRFRVCTSATVMKFLALLIVGWSFVAYVNDARAPYLLIDNYGEWGYREAGMWLNNIMTQKDIVLLRNPMDYYVAGNFIDTYNSLDPYRAKIAALLERKEITYLAIPDQTFKKWESYNQQGGRFISDYVETNHLPIVGRFGTITVYKNI